MKENKLAVLAMMGGLVMTILGSLFIPANAAILNTVDTFTGHSTELGNSGMDTEELWMESVLGGDFDIAKYDDLSASDWTYNVNDIWSYAIDSSIDYFVVKIGNVDGQDETHFLFQNNVDLAFATVSLSDLGITSWDNVDKISHISYRVNETVSVPEPTSFLLLGLGLVGLVGVSRKKKL